jgi:alpha-ribazole phosphatase
VALTLHFIRHGRAEDVDGLCIGHTDRGLSEAGHKEIEAFARRLDVHDLPCISSDLVRARTSAERLTTGPITLDPRLREMNFGEWDGRSWADLELADGAQLNEWMADWTTIRAPGGESFDDVVVRVRSWLDELPQDETRQLVVAHAGSIRAAAVVLLELPPSKAFALQVDHARVSTFSIAPHGATLSAWNSRGF